MGGSVSPHSVTGERPRHTSDQLPTSVPRGPRSCGRGAWINTCKSMQGNAVLRKEVHILTSFSRNDGRSGKIAVKFMVANMAFKLYSTSFVVARRVVAVRIGCCILSSSSGGTAIRIGACLGIVAGGSGEGKRNCLGLGARGSGTMPLPGRRGKRARSG